MENEIKVNEFVRTKDGQIYKIEDGTEFCEDSVNVGIGIIPDVEGIWVDKEHFTYVDKRDIVKHSPNLIDLIQKDDFVNGDRVVAIDYTEDENGNYVDVLGIMEIDDDYAYPIELRVINIQEVVTKEMMESISYKVTKM